MRTYIYPQGTRVRVQRGDAPLDPELVGRVGLVVSVDEYRPERYGVVLDGESAARGFGEDELEAIAPGASPDTVGGPEHGTG